MSRTKPVVLAIDDEPDLLKLLTEVLSQEGYDVRAANSGKLALLSAAAQPPDLILLDLRLPVMDGLEVFRRLKQSNSTHEIPVIFISASNDYERRVEALSMGAVDFVTKPFRREELAARIRNHLELSRLRAKLDDEVARRTKALWDLLAHLRESEERFRLLADTAPVLIWMAGADLSHTFFNKGWLDFTGRTAEQELGNGWIDDLHPDDREHYLEESAAALAEKREFHIEYKLRHTSGEYRWMLSRAVPRFLPDGSFAGYVGSATDITDLRRSREASYDQQRTESLRVLSSGVAHDFRNIAAAILLQVEDAQTEVEAAQSPAEQLAAIKSAASRATEIVTQLMIYAGKENATLEPCNVSSLVEQMVELLKVSIPKGVVLETELDPDARPVWGNATRIRQMIMNLVINAGEAIGREGGVIRIVTSRVARNQRFQPDMSGLPGGEYLRLTVSDTGCGMPPEVRSRIFDPFFTTKPDGHGLGLAVIDGIVRSHNGALNVVSAPGQGTTFEILLPVLTRGQQAGQEWSA